MLLNAPSEEMRGAIGRHDVGMTGAWAIEFTYYFSIGRKIAPESESPIEANRDPGGD